MQPSDINDEVLSTMTDAFLQFDNMNSPGYGTQMGRIAFNLCSTFDSAYKLIMGVGSVLAVVVISFGL